jgi:tRNA(adenine34) deaminase
MFTDVYFMQQAYKEAIKAFEADEVPVGAVVVVEDRIISRGYNMVEKLNDATAHAEIIALTAAFSNMGAKYLPEATLYVTVEPCLMCTGALHWSKVGRVVWGASDIKNGYSKYTEHTFPFHPKTLIQKGIMAEECGELMKSFFKTKRK